MYPVDMLKVRDLNTAYDDALDGMLTAVQTRMQVINPGPTATYTSSIANALVTVSRVEGFRSLWKGLSSVVLGAGICTWLRFVSGRATNSNFRTCARRILRILRGHKTRSGWE